MADLLAKQRLGIAIGLAIGSAATILGVLTILLVADNDADGSQRRNAAPVSATTGHVYTARLGDEFRVPAAAAECKVFEEGAFPTLYCTHTPTARYQVYFYRDRLQVWRNGNPDGPVFSARP
jgi:hypothetical protein